MALVTKKITNSQEDLMKLNQNFDNLSVAIADSTGDMSSLGSFPGVQIINNSAWMFQVSVLDILDRYEVNKCPIIPRVQIYIDGTANTDDNLYPTGGDITPIMRYGISVEVITSRIVQDPVENEKATFFIIIRNNDTMPHDFYVYADAIYLPTPASGAAKRLVK